MGDKGKPVPPKPELKEEEKPSESDSDSDWEDDPLGAHERSMERELAERTPKQREREEELRYQGVM